MSKSIDTNNVSAKSNNYPKYRPWSPGLTEQVVLSANSDLGGNNINQATNSAIENSIHNNMLNNINTRRPNYSSINTDNQDLKLALEKNTIRKKELINEIQTSNVKSPLSLGGFFQPINMQIPNSSQNGQKINRLMHDLKRQEQEITSITANLKISEATEKAEQAELIRRTEEQARISAEKRMKTAIEQVHAAASQLSIAIEKAKFAEQAQKEEEKARRRAEAQINNIAEKNMILEKALQNEIQARKTAEDKAQISLNQTIQTELARQEIEGSRKKLEQEYEELLEKFRKMELTKNSEEISKHELQQQFNRYQEITEHDKQILEKTLQNFQYEQAQILANNDELQNQIAGLEELARQQELQINNLEAKIIESQKHQNKLEQIIETEQNLRKIADQKANNALANTAKSELARKKAEEITLLTKKQARHAVTQASQTVMKFLDSSNHLGNNNSNSNNKEEEILDDGYLEELLNSNDENNNQ